MEDTAESPPSIKFSQFDMMVDAPDSPCVEIYQEFVVTAQRDLDAIDLAISSDQQEEVWTLAHRLKGAAATFGFASLAHSLQEVEQAAKNGESMASSQENPTEQMKIQLEEGRAIIREKRGIGLD